MSRKKYEFIFNYCTMANFTVSFIYPFFPECFQTGINDTGKNNTDLINTENACPYPLIFTLWHTKIKNRHKTGKLEKEKKHVFSLEILETETPKSEKLGKIGTRKN